MSELPVRARFAAKVSGWGPFRRVLGPEVFAKADRWVLERTKGRLAAGGERWRAWARLLDGGEKAARGPDLAAHMPAWDGSTEVTGRDLRVFALERVT